MEAEKSSNEIKEEQNGYKRGTKYKKVKKRYEKKRRLKKT